MKFQRNIQKSSNVAGVVPTVPPSDDHTDGSWIVTDIYIGELFYNSADGILYGRNANGIHIMESSANKVYEAFITQAGVAAPTVVVKRNTIGAIAWARNVAGQYTATLAGAFLAGQVALNAAPNNNGCFSTAFFRVNNNVLGLETRDNALALGDGLLTDRYIKIEIIP